MVSYKNMARSISTYAIVGVIFLGIISIMTKLPIPNTPFLGSLLTEQTIPFHTLAYSVGTSLPKHISTDIVIGPDDGIVLIHSLITIAPGTSLTILPGTTLAVSEFGGLNVSGNLYAKGTASKPITFITNELNELNKHWVGLLLQNSSRSDIRDVIIHHASPAISCAPHATAFITRITFLLDAVGFARNTVGCTIN